MRRFISFLFLFIVISSLALVTAPVRAGTVSYYGVRFDGATSYAEVNDSASLDSITNQFSVVVLFKRASTDRIDSLVSRDDNTNREWNIHVTALNKLKIFISNGTATDTLESNATIEAGRHYLAVGVYTGSELKLYLNGVLDASKTTVISSLNSLTIPLYIGSRGSVYYFDGTIYEVLIYNRALSDSEIQQIYSDPLNPPTDGLVLEYLPSSVDTATNTWDDLSGNGNDGSIVNATYVPLRPISEALQSEASALSFDGSTSYVEAILNTQVNTTAFTLIVFAKDNNYSTWSSLISGKLVSYPSYKNSFDLFSSLTKPKEYLLIGNSTGWFFGEITSEYTERGVIMYSAVYSACSATLYINAKEYPATNNILCSGSPDVVFDQVVIGAQSSNLAYKFGGIIYEVLIYSRALNSTEIREIYEHPLDPPNQGLVLFYSPYSYDPETGKWLNIAPIFPTIPLTEELDAQNYGAEPMRVSIPSAHYLDIENNSEIPVENVSVALLSNNTTISLIPSFLTLPYNSTVTLNVSAVGYLPHLFSLPGSTNDLTVFLTPNNQTTLTLPSVNITNYVQNFTENNFTITPINPYAKALLDSGGSFGDTVKLAIKGDELVKILLPQLTIFAIVIIVFWQSQSPLAALAGALITWGMWQAVLGEAPNLRNSGVTFALVVFLVAWTLWDLFYNYARET